LQNGVASRVNIVLRRFAVQDDSVAALTSVMPLTSASIVSSVVSGGVVLDKASFDTALASDANVVARAAIASGSPVVATPGNLAWRKYSNRMHTAAEQQICEDQPLLPALLHLSANRLVLRPGQTLLVSVLGATVASNAQATHNWFTQAYWEEESIGTFNISGTVTLSSVAVEGAKVFVMESDDQLGANARLVEVKSTSVTGAWASTIRSGCVGSAFVQYKNGATLYTAPGSPFLEP
jgi:hypothetical protein